MEGRRRLSFTVGSFAIAAMTAFGISVLTLTSESGLFTEQYGILAKFDNVQGLLPGAPVWLAGKDVFRDAALPSTDPEISALRPWTPTFEIATVSEPETRSQPMRAKG